MPVAGLPAALETLLSSLLTTEEPTSWKVDGERGSVIVVMKFRQRDADRQPLHTSDWRMGWRKKTPAMKRRDEQRAKEYHQKSKQKLTVTFSDAPSNVSTRDVACDTHSHMPAEYVTSPFVTSEHLIADHNEEGTTTPVSTDLASPPEESASRDDAPDACTSYSGKKGAQEAMRDFSLFLKEQHEAMTKTITEACAKMKSHEPSLLSFPGSSLRQELHPRTTHEETCLLSAPKAPTAIRPMYCPRSADRQCSGEAIGGYPLPSPTRRQPARPARRK